MVELQSDAGTAVDAGPPRSGPHVVMVCWGFPPFRGSGAFRPLAMANGLVRGGARVTVVTTSREVFLTNYGADTSLEEQIDPAIGLVRVPFFPDHAWPVMNDWPKLRAEHPKRFAEQNAPKPGEFPERVYPSWLPRVRDALAELHDRDPIDMILATGGPYVDLQAGAAAARDLGIALVLDDRDSFLADVFTAEPGKQFDERLPYFMEWIELSREAWFVNPPIAEWHRQRFPEYADRIHVVENGWDPGVVDTALITARPHDPLTAGYVGLVPTNFPMEQVLAAWGAALAVDGHTDDLRFYGPLGYEVGSPAWERADAAITAAPRAQWMGHHPRHELAGVYAELDVLLLIKEGGAMVTGGKTYEYAATGLPIAALIDPASDAARVLSEYPRLYVADPADPAAAAGAIAAAIADRRSDDGTRLAAAQEFGVALGRHRALQHHLDRLVERVAT